MCHIELTQRTLEIDNNEHMQLNKPNYRETNEKIFFLSCPHLFTICEQQTYATLSMLVENFCIAFL